MNSKNWKIIPGRNHILIIASHNFPQIRKGSIKKSDVGTGHIVEDLCSATRSWGMISQSVQKDPNWYINSPFRIEVKKLIEIVGIQTIFDIHGRSSTNQYMVELLPNSSFIKHFKNLILNLPLKRFKKDQQLTIAEDLDRSNTPCLEIEIRKDARMVGAYEYYVVLRQIASIIKKSSN